ncbi:MAG: A/G-specific adenine glycosylase [Planctomycetes bacterium]|nr:A/G-specific adenine glycosylase [Planctomycetota bacterium]
MDASHETAFRKPLIRWYEQHARDLPWRRTHDPYQIWISEIMLQQTTVTAVIPYFERFLARFPTVHDLAAADEAEVLKLWEGLGYYSRARNIHKAARVVVDRHDGVFPAELAKLQDLPGIGRYTAGAIASFAFDQRAPIVEANTLRLYCRLLGYDGDPRSTAGQQVLWTFAERVLPKSRPGRFNQALMELGATICTPREPACEQCPVSGFCGAFRDQTQASIPQLAKRAQITAITEASIAVRRNKAYLLRRRSHGERWAGLWDFVRFELPSSVEDLPAIAAEVQQQTGLRIDLGPQLAELKHGVTRYRITLKCFAAESVSGQLRPGEEWQWVKVADFHEFPLSVTGRKFAKLLAESLF